VDAASGAFHCARSSLSLVGWARQPAVSLDVQTSERGAAGLEEAHKLTTRRSLCRDRHCLLLITPATRRRNHVATTVTVDANADSRLGGIEEHETEVAQRDEDDHIVDGMADDDKLTDLATPVCSPPHARKHRTPPPDSSMASTRRSKDTKPAAATEAAEEAAEETKPATTTPAKRKSAPGTAEKKPASAASGGGASDSRGATVTPRGATKKATKAKDEEEEETAEEEEGEESATKKQRLSQAERSRRHRLKTVVQIK
jgi:hypothetical protein